jgi:hypothetical protein
MKKLFVWVLLCLTTLISACPADVAGEWRVLCSFDEANTLKGMPRQADLVCTLDQHRSTITGVLPT